jgi:Fe-Mn family superoxide dismutase
MVILDVPKSLPVNKLESIGISKKTNEGHLKLWQGYAEKNNDVVKALDANKDLKKVNSTYSDVRNQKMAQTFAYGGYLNHKIFFNHLNGNGKPTKEFKALIKDPYDNYENWLEDFKATCLASRGWGYVAYCYEHEMIINVIGDSQNTFPIWNCQLIACIDMYEHARFPEFGTDSAKYIDAVLSIFDYNQIVKNIKRD